MHFEGWFLAICGFGCGYRMRRGISVRDGRMTSRYLYPWHYHSYP
jgi:hypothetical protein